ncbi:MAG: hypothetical protein MRT15_08295 [archaeon YNP-LCB-003-016]|uniref:hypothetical protein n=1 Tax=Candidatus Culexarchaeum yellowstonense TaxID=2928963 RepID=UPI0026F21CCD|nr:hypothetical protein [Candidatus Culexarchaeum yellowstonense]MCR6692377.1 hypothetical protein [Candidatus Culexarchaeum yellowstonense]
MRALWCSKHKPLKAQLQVLQDRGVEIFIPNKTFFIDAEEIVDLALKYNCNIIITVLPLSMIARVCEIAEKHDIIVLYPLMEDLDNNAELNEDTDVKVNIAGRVKVARFKCFKRVRGVKLILEDW